MHCPSWFCVRSGRCSMSILLRRPRKGGSERGSHLPRDNQDSGVSRIAQSSCFPLHPALCDSWPPATLDGRSLPPAPLAGLRSAPRGHRERRPPLCLERPRSDPGRACSLRPQRKRRPQPLHVRVPPGLARSLRTLFS